MATTTSPTPILTKVLAEYGSRLDITSSSHLLVSSGALALSLSTLLAPVTDSFGPKYTIATQPNSPAQDTSGIPNCSSTPVEALPMDHFTHAVFAIDNEDPKFVLAGLKRMIFAMRPKGYAVVVSRRRETKAVAGDGSGDGGAGGAGEEGYQVSLEDKMRYQSRGKINSLPEVMEWAGFERGRVKSLEMNAQEEESGEEVKAEVILAMKWDQLSG